jgi:hypothetical protein
MQQHMKLLGMQVKDAVTGFAGVVSSIGFDLYGCVQAIVTPERKKDGTIGDSMWFDVKRLTVTSKKPVMPVPDFGMTPAGKEIGAALKPAMKSQPVR